MSMTRLKAKWERARDDLGLDIVVPFDLELGNGMTLHVDCLVKSFGGPNGMIIVRNYGAVKEHLKRIRELGFGFAVQDEPRGRDSDLYNRAAMIDMLNDWGWTGLMTNAPSWIRP